MTFEKNYKKYWDKFEKEKKEEQLNMDTLTLTLYGHSAILIAQYYQPNELSSDKNYVLGLIELLTFDSIPKIDEEINKIYVGDREIVILTE